MSSRRSVAREREMTKMGIGEFIADSSELYHISEDSRLFSEDSRLL